MDVTQIDLWSAENLENPWPVYKQLRDAAPAVYLEKYDLWVIGRYHDVRAVLKDWRGASSEHGVTVCKEHDAITVKSILDEAPPHHTELVKVFRENLSPAKLRAVTEAVEQRADVLVAECVAKGEFDAVNEISRIFTVEVVSDMIGIPAGEREGILRRASATFNIFGPDNELWKTRFLHDYQGLGDYIFSSFTREKLEPGGFGLSVYKALDEGRVTQEHAMGMIVTYLVAAIDTTVNSIGSMFWKFAENPDQWQLLKEKPELARNAFDEVLRIETAAFGMARVVVEDYDVDGVTIPAWSKVVPMLRSANRDERRWENPDTFDITRDAAAHVGFGFGIHTCIGRPLAQMQAQAMLKAMLTHIDSMEMTGPTSIVPSNVIRGLDTLPLKVVPARVTAGSIA